MSNFIKMLEKKKKKNNIFLNSFFYNINIFLIDNIIIIPNNIKINKKNQKINIKGLRGNIIYVFSINCYFFIKYNKILINILNIKNKKQFLYLNNKLIKNILKGILQGFKKQLLIKGLGFKFNINNNKLILKLGFSHNIIVQIPNKIKIYNQNNKIIFSSFDYLYLTQFIYYLRSLKKIDKYKEKGLLIQNEKIFRKEGKKIKK